MAEQATLWTPDLLFILTYLLVMILQATASQFLSALASLPNEFNIADNNALPVSLTNCNCLKWNWNSDVRIEKRGQLIKKSFQSPGQKTITSKSTMTFHFRRNHKNKTQWFRVFFLFFFIKGVSSVSKVTCHAFVSNVSNLHQMTFTSRQTQRTWSKSHIDQSKRLC